MRRFLLSTRLLFLVFLCPLGLSLPAQTDSVALEIRKQARDKVKPILRSNRLIINGPNEKHRWYTSLESALKNPENVRKLRIGDTVLTELPVSITDMVNLEVLDLGYHELSGLPESLSRLKKLRSLNLTYNNFTHIPAVILELDSLRSLNLSSNFLAELPDDIGDFFNLQSLQLEDNLLHKLPTSIGQLTELRSLNLSENELEQLPEKIGWLHQLKKLNVSRNELHTLPAGIGKLARLEQLRAKNNQLRKLPGSITRLKALQRLLLSHNKLTALPEGWAQLQQLRQLTLDHNQLENSNMPILISPGEIVYNSLEAALQSPEKVTVLDLSNQALEVLPDAIGRLTNLKKLYLNNNRLSVLPDSILFLSKLELLDASHNQLTTLPATIDGLYSLGKLNLNHNKIAELPQEIMWLGYLEELYLADNLLKRLPRDMAFLDGLCVLDISDNQFEAFPEFLNREQQLDNISFQGNPAQPRSQEKRQSSWEFVENPYEPVRYYEPIAQIKGMLFQKRPGYEETNPLMEEIKAGKHTTLRGNPLIGDWALVGIRDGNMVYQRLKNGQTKGLSMNCGIKCSRKRILRIYSDRHFSVEEKYNRPPSTSRSEPSLEGGIIFRGSTGGSFNRTGIRTYDIHKGEFYDYCSCNGKDWDHFYIKALKGDKLVMAPFSGPPPVFETALPTLARTLETEAATPAPTSPGVREQVGEAAKQENTVDKEAQLTRFSLFPNPTHGEVTIQIDKTVNRTFQIIVYDLCAKRLRQSTFAALEKQTQLQLNELPSGTYFIRIFHPGYEQTLKVIRQ